MLQKKYDSGVSSHPIKHSKAPFKRVPIAKTLRDVSFERNQMTMPRE